MPNVHDGTKTLVKSLANKRLVDRICGEYVDAKLNGDDVIIENYLAKVRPPFQSELLFEILMEEIGFAKQNERQLSQADYEERFLLFKNTVRRAFLLGQNEDYLPGTIDKYEVVRRRGRGASGIVFLAYDPTLERNVALKVSRLGHDENLDESLLEEARISSKFHHPNIVAIFDVGIEEGKRFIVEQYIDGQNLKEYSSSNSLSEERIVELTIEIVDALGSAHTQGCVHRDIKPANVLIDQSGKPYIADFGLAIWLDKQAMHRGEVAGTPMYMSPEQVRGESHRINGTTDIWSVGVILYELICGRRPFHGSQEQLFDAIQNTPPPAPRQLNPKCSPRLEQICLRCLEKLASDRYRSASDLIDALRTSESKTSLSLSLVIPKGLRAFDSGDCNFYCSLLPEPHLPSGVPESIYFWLNKIEEKDPDATFQHGVLCGHSGSGKSSFVKAGIVPLIRPTTNLAYVECTRDDTEVRLLKSVRAAVGDLAKEDLVNTLQDLRETTERSSNDKTLIILDQFEQWLDANFDTRTGYVSTQLAQALRQCDGASMQVLFVLRDDFFSKFDQFSKAIEMKIDQNNNYQFLHPFDKQHALKVLIKLGQGYGKVNDPVSQSQLQFCKLVVDQLAPEERVIAAQLAMFAEMFQDKEWSKEQLHEIGGATGIGVKFLNDRFSSRTSPNRLRQHEKAAGLVLSELATQHGSDLSGRMLPFETLLDVSKYEKTRFEELLQILDTELRLIITTDPDQIDAKNRAENKPSERYYQLSHDSLVKPIRKWKKQQMSKSFAGREWMRLQERAEAYRIDGDSRHKAGVWRWMLWKCMFFKTPRFASEEKLIRDSGKTAKIWIAFGLLVLTFIAGAIPVVDSMMSHKRIVSKVDRQINNLLNQEIVEVPRIASELEAQPKIAKERLHSTLDKVQNNERQRLRLILALASLERDDLNRQAYLNEIAQRLCAADTDFETHQACWKILSTAYSKQFRPLVSAELSNSKVDSKRRFRAACALAAVDADNIEWEQHAQWIADNLADESILELEHWMGYLKSISSSLQGAVHQRFSNPKDRLDAAIFTRAMFHLEDEETRIEILCRKLASANDAHFDQIMQLFIEKGLGAKASETLARLMRDEPSDETDAQYLVALFRMQGLDEIRAAQPVAKNMQARLGDISRPEVRYRVVNFFNSIRVPFYLARKSYELGDRNNLSGQIALLLILANYAKQQSLSTEDREWLKQIALSKIRETKDTGILSAAEYILARMNQSELISKERAKIRRQQKGQPKGNIYIDALGHSMRLIEIENGSSSAIVAVMTNELTIGGWLVFLRDTRPNDPKIEKLEKSDPNRPLVLYDLNLLIKFCNWMSKKDGLSKVEYAYAHNDNTGKYEMVTGAIGYRPPSVPEWESACRAGQKRSHLFFGNDLALADEFAWTNEHFELRNEAIKTKPQPVRMLQPNDYGMHDIYGNVFDLASASFNGSFRYVQLGSEIRGPRQSLLIKDPSRIKPESWEFYTQLGIRIVRSFNK